MVKIRRATKAGFTAKFIGGRFLLIHDGIAEAVLVENVPVGDKEIMRALEIILSQH